jgi:2,3-bisphosphoglycerate-dependent phosphoglycerate mutase
LPLQRLSRTLDNVTDDALVDPLREYFREIFLIGHPEATRLYLVRHGQAGHNVVGLVLEEMEMGGEDPELTGLGFEQARRVGERLARDGVDAVYSSNMLRARQTAEPLAAALALPIGEIPDLREVEMQRPPADSDDEHLRRQILATLRERPAWDAFPGAESSAAFRGRVQRGIDQVVADNPGKRVAVFCHGGVIQVYVSIILGIASDIPFYSFNAGITSIRALGDRRTLWRLNDISHLEGSSFIS